MTSGAMYARGSQIADRLRPLYDTFRIELVRGTTTLSSQVLTKPGALIKEEN